MEYVVDLQGFRRSSNLLQVKELAIMPLDELHLPTSCLFKPPCKWQKLLQQEQTTNRWLEKNYHGIPWNSGEISLNNHIMIIQDCLRDASRIYVKGLEKKRWLQEILPGKFIIDMDEIRCPSLKILDKSSIYCQNHSIKRNAVCAIRNANLLKKWLLDRREQQQQIIKGYDTVDNSVLQKIFKNICIPNK